MAEYIDRVEYCEKHCRCSNEYCDRQSCPIWKAPAADVAPVVHGRWEWLGPNSLVTDCVWNLFRLQGQKQIHCEHDALPQLRRKDGRRR